MGEIDDLNTLPLHDLHAQAGAKFGAFAGWSMPLSYPMGVLQEHLHVREKAGLFDISHMRLVLIEGAGAASALARACPLQPDAMGDGQSKYTFLLNAQAGIIDDLIVTRLAPERFMVVANASRAAVDLARLREAAGPFDCTVTPLDRVLLALQGPMAADVMRDAGEAIDALTFMSGTEPRPGWFLTRSGYTGEDGFEIAMPADEAQAFASRLAGDDRVAWIGLAARDSLRLEAGLCLYGQDLDEETDPVSAGLLWAIPKGLRAGGDFFGADALARIISEGATRKRVGLVPDGRQPVRAGAPLMDEEGRTVGTVTSGGFGPSAGHPVSMGHVPKVLSRPGTALTAEVRGKPVTMTVVKLPFIQKRSTQG